MSTGRREIASARRAGKPEELAQCLLERRVVQRLGGIGFEIRERIHQTASRSVAGGDFDRRTVAHAENPATCRAVSAVRHGQLARHVQKAAEITRQQQICSVSAMFWDLSPTIFSEIAGYLTQKVLEAATDLLIISVTVRPWTLWRSVLGWVLIPSSRRSSNVVGRRGV